MPEVLRQKILSNAPLVEDDVSVSNVNALATLIRSRSMTERQSLVEAVNRRLRDEVRPQVVSGLELLRNSIQLSAMESGTLEARRLATNIDQGVRDATVYSWNQYRGLFAEGTGGSITAGTVAAGAGFLLWRLGMYLSGAPASPPGPPPASPTQGRTGRGWMRKLMAFTGLAALGVWLTARFAPVRESPTAAPGSSPASPSIAPASSPLAMGTATTVGRVLEGSPSAANQRLPLSVTLPRSLAPLPPILPGASSPSHPDFSLERRADGTIGFTPRIVGTFTIRVGTVEHRITVLPAAPIVSPSAAPTLQIPAQVMVGDALTGQVNPSNVLINVFNPTNERTDIVAGRDGTGTGFFLQRSGDNTFTFSPNAPGTFRIQVGTVTRQITVQTPALAPQLTLPEAQTEGQAIINGLVQTLSSSGGREAAQETVTTRLCPLLNRVSAGDRVTLGNALATHATTLTFAAPAASPGTSPQRYHLSFTPPNSFFFR